MDSGLCGSVKSNEIVSLCLFCVVCNFTRFSVYGILGKVKVKSGPPTVVVVQVLGVSGVPTGRYTSVVTQVSLGTGVQGNL